MARKKNQPGIIVGMGKDPEKNLTVQKSMPLLSLWRSDMSLSEFKILDTYLSRINSHDPTNRTVVFTKGELEQLCGVTKINKADLLSRLKGLYRGVDLEGSEDDRFQVIALFEEASGALDENGIWTVKLTCTEKAMRYIFNIEHLRYIRYRLRSIISLNSRYSYVLFCYLESNRFRKSWEVELDELRRFLNCDEDLYNEFKYFNQRILRRCQAEIREKMDCRFTYEPVKAGRKVIAVRFTLETIADILSARDELEGQQQLPWFDEDPGDPLAFLGSACQNEFSREQMQEIFSVICTKTINQLPVAPGHPGDLEFSRYHYLAQMYARMQVVASKEKIYHRYDYFLAMLKKDR